MTELIIKKLFYDLTSNGGLDLVGQYLKSQNLSSRNAAKLLMGSSAIINSDFFKSPMALLVQGKNNFEAIKRFQGDGLFWRALCITTVHLARPCASA